MAEDIPLLHSLLSDVFPGVKYSRAAMKELRAEIAKVCAEMHLVYGDTGSQWVDKVCGREGERVGGWMWSLGTLALSGRTRYVAGREGG